MSAVTNTTILSQASKNVKAVLQSEVGTTLIDPKSGSRGSDEAFIRLTRARRKVYYPHIVVESFLGPGQLLSLQGEQLKYLVQVQITVFSNNMKHMDEITSQVIEVMRSKKSTFDSYKMYRTSPYLISISPVLAEQDSNVYSRALTYQFLYFAQ